MFPRNNNKYQYEYYLNIIVSFRLFSSEPASNLFIFNVVTIDLTTINGFHNNINLSGKKILFCEFVLHDHWYHVLYIYWESTTPCLHPGRGSSKRQCQTNTGLMLGKRLWRSASIRTMWGHCVLFCARYWEDVFIWSVFEGWCLHWTSGYKSERTLALLTAYGVTGVHWARCRSSSDPGVRGWLLVVVIVIPSREGHWDLFRLLHAVMNGVIISYHCYSGDYPTRV